MKVYKLTFRTPGIFLDDQFEAGKGKLYFEVRNSGTEEEFKPVEEFGVQMISEKNFKDPNSVVENLIVQEPEVPSRDDGKVTYYAILKEDQCLEYRIVAENCPDCWDFYRDSNKDSSWFIEGGRRGKILVGRGTFGNCGV